MTRNRTRIWHLGGQLQITKRKVAFWKDIAGYVYILGFVLLFGSLTALKISGTAGWSPAALVPLLFGVVLVGGCCAMLLIAVRNMTEDFTLDRATDRFLRNKELLCPLTGIDHIEALRHEAGNRLQLNHEIWYDVHACLKDGRRILITDEIPGFDGGQLSQEMARYAGVPVEGDPTELVPADPPQITITHGR